MVRNILFAVLLFFVYSVRAMAPVAELVNTSTQFAFIEEMNQDLQSFLTALTTDRQLFQSWNEALIQLTNTLNIYEQQHTEAITQVRYTIVQLYQLLADKERQGQDQAVVIADLSEQLATLQQQTDQEIIALQQQLDDTMLELDMLENEYGDFIDASFAHAQGFYNMLQLAKQEYAHLIGERTEFFNSLQALTDALHNHALGVTTQLLDLVEPI